MIDISQERLIALRDAPRNLPARPNGKRVHISACYRWISRGVRGVCLESIRIGGTTYTSLEALQRFADHLGTPSSPRTSAYAPPTRTRQKQIDQASKRLAEALGLNDIARSPAADQVQGNCVSGNDKPVPNP